MTLGVYWEFIVKNIGKYPIDDLVITGDLFDKETNFDPSKESQISYNNGSREMLLPTYYVLSEENTLAVITPPKRTINSGETITIYMPFKVHIGGEFYARTTAVGTWNGETIVGEDTIE